MNEISIAGETYSEIVRQKFTLYSTSSFPLSKDCMYTRRNEWEEDKEFTADKEIDMGLNKYKNLPTSGRWSNKDTNDAHILIS